MTLLDLDQLAHVTGGRGCQLQQQPQQGDPQAGAAPEGAAPQGGNMMAGLDQFLSFFQSDGFQQLIGGLRSMMGSAGGAQQQPQPQAMPQQAPQAQ
jgi:hypothetical protein